MDLFKILALRMAGMLHDVGKVAIPDVILKKPGRLDPEEYKAMKRHTYLGAQLFIDPSSEFDVVALNHMSWYEPITCWRRQK